jgi:GT2 family glycosyltransferase
MSAERRDIDVSVSIVSMNNPEDLGNCLRTLYQHNPRLRLQVVVVFYRTPSTVVEEMRREFPQIEVVLSQELRGYSENQNLGLRKAEGRYALILNDDVQFIDDAIQRCFDFAELHPEAAAVTPKLLNPDGSVQMAIRGHFSSLAAFLFLTGLKKRAALFPPLREHIFDDPGHDAQEPVMVEVGTGAFFFVRREVLESVGYMDERFFLAPDDIDLSTRLIKSGHPLVYLPDVQIIHLGSRTLSTVFSKVLVSNNLGLVRYFQHHGGSWDKLFIRWTVLVTSLASLVYWWVKRLREPTNSRARTMLRGRINVLRFLFSRRSAKEIFDLAR